MLIFCFWRQRLVSQNLKINMLQILGQAQKSRVHELYGPFFITIYKIVRVMYSVKTVCELLML